MAHTMFDKKIYSDAERIQRVWDIIEIKNVMALHIYYHCYARQIEELEDIWVQKPENKKTASFGQSRGYMLGYDKIMQAYGINNLNNQKKALAEAIANDPTIEDCEDNLGLGQSFVHAITTPYIELAGDGQTAQGVWYTPGHTSGSDRHGYMYEKYFIDFIKEDGEWKIWHLFVGTDFSTPPGEGFGGPTELEREKNPPPPGQGFPGGPPPGGGNKEPDPYYFSCDAYTMKFNYCHQKPLPKPYWTFSETRSYGPDGEEGFSWDMVYGGK
ncbi:MAG: nuclear transport factor 2 family protein [Ruminococcaceae bacterium]|nr:nuclear transport factor 2 family protein [Oscillospiraceae bacterium]